jgi:uroporphyrinogen-III decarboxylase
MNDQQWKDLLAILEGRTVRQIPCGFIVDSPWLPGWFNVSVTEYLASETVWFEANRSVIETFPDVWFLPGFWSEFGMCTEPSAFGARCMFPADQFPFAEPAFGSIEDFAEMKAPDPATHGFLPLVLNRLKWARPRIEDLGHRIRFSVSRGPFNIAAFVMGSTEFLVALKTQAGLVHRFMRKITDFLKQWHDLQRSTFPSIDGILILDDFVGFVSEKDFVDFALPYLRELFETDVSVRFFHNDAPCERSIRHYPEIRINLFNPGTQTPLHQLRALSDNRLSILGTIPPLDVLARGTPDEVRSAVRELLAQTPDRSRLILSCAGGMPPGVPAENIHAFLDEAKNEAVVCREVRTT